MERLIDDHKLVNENLLINSSFGNTRFLFLDYCSEAKSSPVVSYMKSLEDWSTTRQLLVFDLFSKMVQDGVAGREVRDHSFDHEEEPRRFLQGLDHRVGRKQKTAIFFHNSLDH